MQSVPFVDEVLSCGTYQVVFFFGCVFNTGVAVPTGQNTARRIHTNSSASSLDSHSAAPSPLMLSGGIPHSASGNVVATVGTPPMGRDRDSGSVHLPLTRKRAVGDTTSLGSSRMSESIASVSLRPSTSTPSSGGGSSGKFVGDEADVMTALDAIRTGGAAAVSADLAFEPEDEVDTPRSSTQSAQSSIPVIRELTASPTRRSPAPQRRSVSPHPPDVTQPEEGDSNADASWFEYGCV